MLIDWFTVGAQAVNFLILVWLLKRFLYRPVLAAVDAREEEDRRADRGCCATLEDEGASRTCRPPSAQ
jgi:F-type H+-transporting ATPase subunit b